MLLILEIWFPKDPIVQMLLRGQGVRCCADVAHHCASGAACHPAGSLLSCEELASSEAARSQVRNLD